MASKLKKAVKANCVARDDADGPGFLAGTGWPKQWPGQEPCYIVPAAEYERLTKADKLAAQLMEHEACVSECDKCKERRKISDNLARVVSVRRKARNAK